MAIVTRDSMVNKVEMEFVVCLLEWSQLVATFWFRSYAVAIFSDKNLLSNTWIIKVQFIIFIIVHF